MEPKLVADSLQGEGNIFTAHFTDASRQTEERSPTAGTKTLAVRVHIWCLNSAIAFEALKREARSIILASGTLAPMDSFASELDVDFAIRLETNHVIDPSKQLWAGVLARDASGQLPFNWTFKNTENAALQDALGRTLLEICKVVPKGVLCFFSGYAMLNKVVGRWRATGFFEELCACKCVLVEPNGPVDGVIASFFRANGDDSKRRASRKSRDSDAVVVLPSQTGGLMLAVCRGKVSEGISFSDDQCRAVVVVGIPFPNTRDALLQLKKDYHDLRSKASPAFLNGSSWYALQAFRALNQAVGRCIRHRTDYGAVLLLDERYTERANTSSLSKWMRPSVTLCDNFEHALASLADFYARNAEPAMALSAPPSGNRWCCARCFRPLSLLATPTAFKSNKPRLVELAGAATSEVDVLLFDVNTLNIATLTRDKAVYAPADGVAYMTLRCACGTAVGVIVEAANAANVQFLQQVWIPRVACWCSDGQV